jgi:flagellar hook assembly protein FlgD
MRVYDVRGALVRGLVDENRGSGLHSATWDGRDNRGRRAASGVYYVRFQAGGKAWQQKVVLVR